MDQMKRLFAAVLCMMIITVMCLPSYAESGDNAVSGSSGQDTSAAQETDAGTAADSETDVDTSDPNQTILYIEQSVLHTPDTQNIAVVASDPSRQVTDAVLYYNENSDSTKTVSCSKTADQAMLFTLSYETVPEDIAVSLVKCVYYYTSSDSVYIQEDEINFEDESSQASFLVTSLAADDPSSVSSVSADALSETDETSTSVYTISDDGSFVKADSVSDALEKAGADQSTVDQSPADDSAADSDPENGILASSTTVAEGLAALSTAASSSDAAVEPESTNNIVVAIDPGHDSTHHGASWNGLKEEDINLKVALACKAELETYSGITVYMTRTASSCPYPETTSPYGDNHKRISAAVAAGADVYVAIHMNASTNTSANGVSVYVQNQSWLPAVANEGTELGRKIISQITKLGINVFSSGIVSEDATDGSTYNDGSVADYLTVNNECKENHIPGIIVEHAFVSNASDAAFLSSDTNLTALGKADAAGIAQQYSLKKKSDPTVSVSDRDDFNGSFHITAGNLASGKTVEAHISCGGQAETVTDMTETSYGTYELDDTRDNHDGLSGSYTAALYYAGSSTKLCSTTFKLYDSSVSFDASYTDGHLDIGAYAEITNPASDIVQVYFPIWSKNNGQDDLTWSTGTRSGNTWRVSEYLSSHMSYGEYEINCYAQLADGSMIFLGGKSVMVTKPSADGITVTNINSSAGTFDVVVSGLHSILKVDTLYIPVWNKSDQSDIIWYAASQQSDGSYIAHVDTADHGYQVGTYHIHVYLDDELGIMTFLGSTSTKVGLTPCTVTATASGSTGEFYNMNASGIIVPGGYDKIYFAVWSEEGGQDDIAWYAGTKSGSAYTYKLDVKNHKSYGTYHIHVYAVCGSDFKFLGSTSFDLPKPSVADVAIANADVSKGTFDIVISGVQSAHGVSQLLVPVWSESDQSNIKWYEAVRQSDGTYLVSVDIKNHGYQIGEYQIHVYLTDSTGIQSNVFMTSYKISLSSATVSASADETDISRYNLSASGVIVPGGYTSAFFAVWSKDNGQDDLKWYKAQIGSGGKLSYTMDLKDHQSYGDFNVHCYVVSGSTYKFIGSTGFTIDRPSIGSVEIVNQNETAGTFDILVSDVVSASGVGKIMVPVWSKSDQSNIHWYEAVKQSDGTYLVHVDLKNHDYQVGTYQIHVYMLDGREILSNLFMTKTEVSLPDCTVSAVQSENVTGQYDLKASGVIVPGGYSKAFFAVWSTDGGQDDLKWYQASKNADGTLTYSMNIKDHNSYGTYLVHAYAVSNGTYKFLGSTAFEAEKPSISGVAVSNVNVSAGTFDITVSGAASPNGIQNVYVPVWSKRDQSNIKWYQAEKQNDGTYLVHADLKNHDYQLGTYAIHVYIQDDAGILTFAGNTDVSIKLADCGVKAEAADSMGAYALSTAAVTVPGGYTDAYFAVWSKTNGQDDIKWYPAGKNADGTLSYTMNIKDHGDYGTYYVHAYAVSGSTFKFLGATAFDVSSPSIDSVVIENQDENSGEFDIAISGIQTMTGIGKVQAAVWSESDQSNIKWYTADKENGGTYVVHVDPANHGYKTGTYNIHVYLWDSLGIASNLKQLTADVSSVLYHTIMGTSDVTAEQLANYYNTYSSIAYPSEALGAGGAPTLESFCTMYVEEAKAEGVKTEVAFAQAMLETGYLSYQQDVSIEQFNFAGMGAIGNGVKGNSFPDVRTGIRAQIQHLKCYASTEPLVNTCVDPRWYDSLRGKAIYIEYLSIKHNPYGTGWAADEDYASKILSLIAKIKNS